MDAHTAGKNGDSGENGHPTTPKDDDEIVNEERNNKHLSVQWRKGLKTKDEMYEEFILQSFESSI